jgi:hypothetical protein
VVGRVTDTGRWVVRATPGYDPLSGAPGPTRPPSSSTSPWTSSPTPRPSTSAPASTTRGPATATASTRRASPSTPAPTSWSSSAPNVGSRAWIYRQYDHIVRDGTVVRPGAGDAAVVRALLRRRGARREKLIAISERLQRALLRARPAHRRRHGRRRGVPQPRLRGRRAHRPHRLPQLRQPRSAPRSWRSSATHRRHRRRLQGPRRARRERQREPLQRDHKRRAGPARCSPRRPSARWASSARRRRSCGRASRTAGDVVALLGPQGPGALGGSEWLTRKCGRVCGTPPRIDLAAEAALQKLLVSRASPSAAWARAWARG